MYDIEPLTASHRIGWYMSRLHDWIVAASQGCLNEDGDPFELPHFPLAKLDPQIAFVEDQASFDFWQLDDHPYGIVDFSNLVMNPSVLAVTQFKKRNGQELLGVKYGDAVQSKVALTGLWIRTQEVPHIPPWQAPTTLAELVRALSSVGIDVQQLLRDLAKTIRDGVRHPLLIGFPIPSTIGSPLQRYHWQALLLPVLSNGNAKGFSSSEKGYLLRDGSLVLTSHMKLEWLGSVNWEESELRTRGKLPACITSKKILIIGAGAIGSMIAELLAREGCHDFVIVDNERLQVGNLTRHTLDLHTVGDRKADALALRLVSLNPHAHATAIPKSFPPLGESDRKLVQSCDCVIDCTADDTVLYAMSIFDWKSDKQFLSVSVGLFAKRIFLFSSFGRYFPHSFFIEKTQPWIENETREYSDAELPREGIGCWHPIFPASPDDLWMAVSVAGKRIASIASASNVAPTLEVFEQEFSGGLFQGIKKVA
ncbi:MAG: ThiF family adenylyltransferase [Ignavibacteriae bacterium]|nr:ThiF family adenylyltransferase [Ignavibacteriota bacterium]